MPARHTVTVEYVTQINAIKKVIYLIILFKKIRYKSGDINIVNFIINN